MIYDYECPKCGHTEEVNVSLETIEKGADQIMCPQDCQIVMKRLIGNNGGFRLGTKRCSVSWGDGGYSDTYGDIQNFKAGRKVYE